MGRMNLKGVVTVTFQESETVELKSIVTEDVRKEIIAFANGEGGKLYIGIEDDGTVIGLSDPDGAALQISNMVRDTVKPDLTMFVHYETLDVDGTAVVRVDVQRGTQRPYYYSRKGLRPEGVFVRQGYSSVPASETAIRMMIKETDGDRFEDMRSLEQNLTFDSTKKEFAKRSVAFGKAQMRSLGIMTADEVYTNLGMLLSDQCTHTVKAAVFQGNDQNVFKDRKEFTGSLFQQMEDVYAYIDFHNRTGSTFEGLYRVDTRDYPETAVRESLLNMLVHREYAFRASSFISLYADRIEFASVGGLVSGFTLHDVMAGISVCRNAKLANVFYRLELIEAYGTGMRKILDAYKGSGRTPLFETTDKTFKVTLPNMNAASEKAVTEKGRQSSKSDAHSVIEFLKERGSASRREIQSFLGKSQSSCSRFLQGLVNDGILFKTGGGKNTKYTLK